MLSVSRCVALSFGIFCLLLASSVVHAEDAAAAAKVSREAERAKKREDHWLKSILSCPLCKGKQVLACYYPCREEGGGMAQCLTQCMTNNPLVLEMMLKLMPNIGGDDTAKQEKAKDETKEPQLEDVDLAKHANFAGAASSHHSEL